MLAGNVLEGLQTVVNKDVTMVFHYIGVVNDGIGATLLEGALCILVAIKLLAFQGQKDAALRAVAAIRGDAWMLLIEMI